LSVDRGTIACRRGLAFAKALSFRATFSSYP
jgi:hypothetical protein